MADTEIFLPKPANKHIMARKDCANPQVLKTGGTEKNDVFIESKADHMYITGGGVENPGQPQLDSGFHLYENGKPLKTPEGVNEVCKAASLTARHEVAGGEGTDELRFLPRGSQEAGHVRSAFTVKSEGDKPVLRNLFSGTEYALNSIELVRFGDGSVYDSRELLKEARDPSHTAIANATQRHIR